MGNELRFIKKNPTQQILQPAVILSNHRWQPYQSRIGYFLWATANKLLCPRFEVRCFEVFSRLQRQQRTVPDQIISSSIEKDFIN